LGDSRAVIPVIVGILILGTIGLSQDAEAKDLDTEINCINGDLVIIVKDEQGNPLSGVRVGTADYPTRYPEEKWLTDTNGTVTIKSSSNLGYVNFSKGGYNEIFFATPCQITVVIPEWIHNNAKWWSEGAIGDSDFISGVQYLIIKGIIKIPEVAKASTVDDSQEIPSWIKNNAGWWADGLISDEDFVSGIKYLVEQGIIKV